MRLFRSIRCPLLTLASCLFIAACGGGGGSTAEPNVEGVTRTALPTVITDQEPTDASLELDSAYFVSQVGDTFEFTTTDAAGYQSTRQRLVVAHPSAINGFVLEDTEGGETWSTVYLRDSNGWRQDFRHYSDIPQGARAIMGTVLEFPSHVSERGQTRRSVRQGGWDEDLDGDRIHESFRLEFVQRFVGLEPEVQFGKTLTLAHFQTTVTFSLVFSRAANATQTVITTEDTYLAQGFGQVRVESTERVPGGGISSVSNSRLKDSMSGGKSWADYIRTNGTKIPVDLTFRDMVYDKHRNVYYASIPASDLVDITLPARIPTGANSIATIDAATGRVTYSAPVGVAPGPLALASNGSVLWVGVDSTFEVLQLSLPDMAVTSRISVSAYREFDAFPVPASQLQPSPTDPTVFAAVLARSHGARSVATILVKNMVTLPAVLTSTPDHIPSYSPHINLLAFDETGTTLFGIDTYDSALLSRMQVLDSGLVRDSVTSYNTTDFGRASGTNLDFLSNALVADNKIISIGVPSMSYAAIGAINCRKLNAEKTVCLRNQVDASNFITGLELVPISMSDKAEGTAISVGSASGQNVTAMVAGSNGQIAIGWREGVSTSGSPSNRLALFRSTELR